MMESKRKREVKVPFCELSAYQLEGDVEKIAPIFTNTLEWFKVNISTVYKTNPSLYDSCHRFELEHNIGWDDESDSYDLLGWRWETDEEVKKRIEIAKKQSVAQATHSSPDRLNWSSPYARCASYGGEQNTRSK